MKATRKTVVAVLMVVSALSLAACKSSGNSVASASSGGTQTPTTSPSPSPTPTPSPAATYISGYIVGGAQTGVTVTASPGGTAATTGASGAYTLSNLPDGTYTITPSDGSGTVFSPASKTVTVNGAGVAGVNFTAPTPPLTTGDILFPCLYAVCVENLATGTSNVLLQNPSVTAWQPLTIVPMRVGISIAYDGSNLAGPSWVSFLPGMPSPPRVFMNGGNMTPNCSAITDGRSFDTASVSGVGDIAVVTAPCSVPGVGNKTDIFIVQMDGSGHYVRVTSDMDIERSPVFAGINLAKSQVTVLFVDTTTGNIMKQVVDVSSTSTTTLVGAPTVFAKDAADDDRALSVNLDYTKVAFVQKVNGLNHLMVEATAGGPVTDLGLGDNPYWDLGGSNLIEYSYNGKLYAVKPDGTGRVAIPVPGNLSVASGPAWVVFAPPGG
ncbi:MAG: hypothetical protein B7X04_02335 [Parcubacteria group bacterium 21-54-25]|nr:MAG: hypothetical protein B7X04_02335 [Parcubacteria group bacterium 21-54-25]HQU07885.1 hypothetical protein [Candidatus Paceibacterota bacterium]